jgi:NADH dehydrogenase
MGASTVAPGSPQLNVVTGAFGYTGKYITRRLLSEGESVRTLTRHPQNPNLFGDRVKAFPFNFDRPGELRDALRGAEILYNTYWVRFPRGEVTFDRAVENTRTLIQAAQDAGVRKIVHISITNAAADSPLPYFRGKGLVEEAIIHSKLSYAIIRPSVVFGAEDILINNIAWLLRRFPLFPVAGAGEYPVRPVYVEDVAELAVEAAHHKENLTEDAVGPETYSFNELVRLIADKAQSKARIIHIRPGLALFLSQLVGYLVRDVVLTREEMEGLMAGLLASPGPPTGQTRLSHWLEENRDRLGTRYAPELRRHYK